MPGPLRIPTRMAKFPTVLTRRTMSQMIQARMPRLSFSLSPCATVLDRTSNDRTGDRVRLDHEIRESSFLIRVGKHFLEQLSQAGHTDHKLLRVRAFH
jgi:hypothetical protein